METFQIFHSHYDSQGRARLESLGDGSVLKAMEGSTWTTWGWQEGKDRSKEGLGEGLGSLKG